MWAVEKDPALRSDFCNLTILDRRPSDDRVRATMQRALEAIPRLAHFDPLKPVLRLERLRQALERRRVVPRGVDRRDVLVLEEIGGVHAVQPQEAADELPGSAGIEA